MTGPTYEEQIKELNERVKLKLGAIAKDDEAHIGVFAMRNIKKGETLLANHAPKPYSLTYDQFDKLKKDVKEHILTHFPSVINGSYFAFPWVRYCSYMNHSENDNYDPNTDTALKDIKKGEEVVCNYKNIPNAGTIYPWLK